MERRKIKLALLVIAAAGTAYWAQPPYLWGGPMMAAWCFGWACLALAAFRWDRAEDWTYRLSSFLGIALATVEGSAAFLGLHARGGLFLMAAIHVAAFLLAMAGRYQKVSSKRPRVL